MAPFKRVRPMAHEVAAQGKPPGYTFGRPTKYRSEYCDLVLERMSEGLSLTAFAGSIKCNTDTIMEWIATHEDFSEAVTKARNARTCFLERKLLAVKNGSEAATSIFALKNACPSEWKEVRYENVEHSVNLDGITDEQLAAIALGRQTPMIDVTPKKVTKR